MWRPIALSFAAALRREKFSTVRAVVVLCLTKSLCLGKDVVANLGPGYTMELVCRVGVWEILFSLDRRGRALGCNLEVSLLL